MGIFGNKKIQAFGLDISDTSIKVMELTRQKGVLRRSGAASMLLYDKVIRNNVIINEARLAENIKAALSLGHISSRYAVCSIPEAKSFVRNLTLPPMTPAELDTAVSSELGQDIPIPVDQVYLDWQIIHESADKIELLVTASPKAYVDAMVESLKLAGVVPVAMELESQATARALIGPADAARNILIVDLATMQTSFIIVEAGVIQYTSSVPIAGRALTENIARDFNIQPEAAEKIKQGAGLVAMVDGINIRASISPLLDNLAEEIKKILRFFTEREGNKTIETIMLCGGTAALAGLADYLSEKINTAESGPRVILGDPWVNINATAAEGGSINQLESLGFATVTGLALRGVDNEAD